MKKHTAASMGLILGTVFLVLWGIANISSIGSVFSAVVSVLTPIIAGFAIAFILNIPLRGFERIWIKLFTNKLRALRRAVCIVLCLIGFAGVLTLLGFLIIPEIISAIRDDLLVRIPYYVEELKMWYGMLGAFLAKFSVELPQLNISVEQITGFISKYVSNNASNILSTSVNIATTAFGVVFDGVCAFVISIYVLFQKETLGRQSRKLLYAAFSEKTADRLLALCRLTEKSFSKFISGQLTEAVIIGVLCFIGMLIFKMPYALIISVMVGVTALIPIFGAFIGTGFGAVLILFESPLKALGFVVFILVLQQLEGNIIYPKVVGTQVGLPGLWVLIAVTVGAEFGIVGMLISVPIMSLIYTVTKQVVNAKLSGKGFDGLFEESEPPEKKKKEKKQKRKRKKDIAAVAEAETDVTDNEKASE